MNLFVIRKGMSLMVNQSTTEAEIIGIIATGDTGTGIDGIHTGSIETPKYRIQSQTYPQVRMNILI